MTVTGDGDLAAGDAPGIDVARLQMFGDPFEPPLIEARGGRINLHVRCPGIGVADEADRYRPDTGPSAVVVRGAFRPYNGKIPRTLRNVSPGSPLHKMGTGYRRPACGGADR